MMAKRQVILSFNEEALKEPIIFNLGQQFNLVFNIQLADITSDRGWIELELEGNEDDIDQGISWITSRGVRVEQVTGNTPKY